MLAVKKAVANLVLIWLAWAILILVFQKAAVTRLQLKLPDTVLDWVSFDSTPEAHARQPYLLEPFLNEQVAYDSEFYLSIAIAGYNDPLLRTIWLPPNREPELIWSQSPLPLGIPKDYPTGRPAFIPADYNAYSLNYAFFPLYPLAMRLFDYPLKVFGLNPIATATLSGVFVSILGTLAAMLALYDLTRDEFGHSGALKTAFYLVIFPTGFFLAMVLTEGLFAGLAFGSLALIGRKKWFWAGLLAACATLTRAVGAALVVPLGIAWVVEARPLIKQWLEEGRIDPSMRKQLGSLIWKGVAALGPLYAYAGWYILLGRQFHAVETAFFSRGAFLIETSTYSWGEAFLNLFNNQDQAVWIGLGIIALTVCLLVKILFWNKWSATLPKAAGLGINLAFGVWSLALIFLWFQYTLNAQRSFYFVTEFSATILALAGCAYLLRKRPGLAYFNLLVVLISFFSGAAQGMPRYILGAPAVFIMLGDLGKDNDIFDRAWTIGSVLFLGLFALLFAFNFWVA